MDDVLRLPGGVEARVQVSGADSGGAFTLITDVVPPGWSLGAHRHAGESETIHVVAGALWLEVEGRRRELRAGDTAFVPQGAVHSGGTLGDDAARRVLVFSPAGMDEFFTRLASETDPAAMARLAADYGWRFG